MIGREPELEALRAGVEDACSKRGRLFVLMGEPGIGKTRIAEEIACYAQGRGARVLWGRCFEEEGAPAFWPWVQVLREATKDLDADVLRGAIGLGGRDIAELVPALRQRLPDLPSVPVADLPRSRFQLFDSIAQFLGQLAQRAPLVLILEDLHGADEPSLRLLQFIVRELSHLPMLLVVTLRDATQPRHHALTAVIEEVLRQQSSSRLALTGLSRAQVERFMHVTAGHPCPQSVVTAVHERSGGNPLFVGEFVRLLMADGLVDDAGAAARMLTRIPDGVKAVIHRRVLPLSPFCNAALASAAVMGREFSAVLLARVLGESNTALLDWLREAVRARVLCEVTGKESCYRFTHALIRETLYDDLAIVERSVLHRRIGEAIERLPDPEAHLPELAHHFFEAARDGDTTMAATYAWRAGDRALALRAYEEAARLYDLALLALELCASAGGDAGQVRAQRYELLMARGTAQRATDVAGAVRTFTQAVELARTIGSAQLLGRAVLGTADWLPLEHADPGLVHLLEEAIDRLCDTDDALRARLLSRLAIELSLSDESGRRVSLARQAVEIARSLDDASLLAQALFALHVADCGPDNAGTRLSVATEIVRAAEQAGDSELMWQGRMCRIVDLLELADGAALDAEIESFARLADALRQPRYRAWSAHFQGVRATYQGRFDAAEQLASEMLAQAQLGQERAAESLFGGEMFALRSTQGRLAEFEQAMKGLAEHLDTKQGDLEGVRCGLAAVYSELGRTAEARSEFEHFAADRFASLRRGPFWLNSMACLVRACVFLGDVPRAAVLYDLLLPYAERAVAMSHPGTFYDGPVAHYLGILAAMTSQWEVADRHLEYGLEINARMGARPHLARTQYAYAEMLLAAANVRNVDETGTCAWLPDLAKARMLLAQAMKTARELDMNSLAERARALAQSARLPMSGAEQDATFCGSAHADEGTADAGGGTLTAAWSVFRRDGDFWTVAYGERESRLKDTKGVQWIAHLLQDPGREFLALDLVGGAAASQAEGNARCLRGRNGNHDADAVLDAAAVAAYKRRLLELREELQEAEGFNDLGRASRARDEMEALSQHLARAMGLHGPKRLGRSNAERARQTVTKGIKSAIARICAANPALARHLTQSIVTGYFCSYQPDPDRPVSWSF